MSHPMFLEWVRESVGALKGTDKTGGYCRLCCFKKKRLTTRTCDGKDGIIEKVRLCLPCNRLVEKIEKMDMYKKGEEGAEVIVGRMNAANRLRLLHHALINEHPAPLIVSLLRAILRFLFKDPDIVQAALETREKGRDKFSF